MQCNRCGASIIEVMQPCPRCGNSCISAAVKHPSFSSSCDKGTNPSSAQHDLSDQHSLDKELVDPVVSVVSADPAVSAASGVQGSTSSSTSKTTASTAVMPRVVLVPSERKTCSSASSCASTSHTQPSNPQAPSSKSSALKKRLLIALSSIAVVCVAVCVGLFAYFANRVGDNDVRVILDDSYIVQQGLISSNYTDPSPYRIQALSIDDQHELSQAEQAQLSMPPYIAEQRPHKVVCDAKIANDSIESSFKATMYVVKSAGKWTAISGPSVDTDTLDSKPLKGISGKALGSDLDSSQMSSEGDLQQEEDGYTSTITTVSHTDMWYGTITTKHNLRFMFDKKQGWTPAPANDNKEEMSVEWNIKGKTFVKTDRDDWFVSTDNISIVVNDIDDTTADLSYSISSTPKIEGPNFHALKLSGRRSARVSLDPGNRLSLVMQDPDNGVTITIHDGGLYPIGSHAQGNSFVALIKTNSVVNSFFMTTYSRQVTLQMQQ